MGVFFKNFFSLPFINCDEIFIIKTNTVLVAQTASNVSVSREEKWKNTNKFRTR